MNLLVILSFNITPPIKYLVLSYILSSATLFFYEQLYSLNRQEIRPACSKVIKLILNSFKTFSNCSLNPKLGDKYNLI